MMPHARIVRTLPQLNFYHLSSKELIHVQFFVWCASLTGLQQNQKFSLNEKLEAL